MPPTESFNNYNTFSHLPSTSSHLHPLQVEYCDSNSRLVVDEDDNGKFRIQRVKELKKADLFKATLCIWRWSVLTMCCFSSDHILVCVITMLLLSINSDLVILISRKKIMMIENIFLIWQKHVKWIYHYRLEVVSRWRDSQLQVGENYSDLTKWRSSIQKFCWLMSCFKFNMSNIWYVMYK